MIPVCSAPFYTFSVKPEGFRPCCSRHAKPVVMDDPASWWNSEYLRNFRKRMLDGDLPDECRKCIASGDSGGQKYSPKMDVVKEVGYVPATGHVRKNPGQILYFTGNKCNLACRMCDSTFSDTHGKSFPELRIPIKVENEGFNSWRSTLDGVIAAQPREICLYGGEPFMARDIYEIVETLLRETNTVLAFLSNGSFDLERHKLYPLLVQNPSRFAITYSIDGTPELNEKIRVLCKTDLIAKNIKTCQDIGVYCESHFTLSNMNIHELPEYIEYIETNFGKKFPFNIASVEFPSHFAPQVREDVDEVRMKLVTYFWQKMMKGEMRLDVYKALTSAIHKLSHPRDVSLIPEMHKTMEYIDACIFTNSKS